MKATLEFQLPEETYEYETINKAKSYKAIVEEIREQLRTYRKHGHDFDNADDVICKMECMVIELLRDEGIVE